MDWLHERGGRLLTASFKNFLSGVVFLLAILLMEPLAVAQQPEHPHTVSPPAKIDLNGRWKDQYSSDVEITQTGNSVTVKTSPTTVFTGTLSGDWLDVSHDLSFEETRKDLPSEIRVMITNEKVFIRGKVAADGQSIDASYIESNPDWENVERQYKITAMKEGRTPLPLTRGGYHISELVIDYTGWEVLHTQLKQKIVDAEGDLQLAQSMLDGTKKAYDAARAKLDAAKAAVTDAQSQLDAAMAKAAASSPPESTKSAQYKQTEAKLKQRQARHDQLYQRIQDLPKVSPNADPSVMDKLLQEYDQTGADIKALQATLQSLQDKSGFSAQQQAAKQEADRLDDIYWERRKTAAHAESDLEIAYDVSRRAEQRVDQKREDLAKAQGDWDKFNLEASPRIVDVQLGKYYHAQYWTPVDVLKQIDPSINELQAELDRMEEIRKHDREMFKEAGDKSLEKGRDLYRAQWKSFAAQAGVETLNNIYDVVKAAGNGAGLAGAAGEAVKKLVEAFILGPAEFAEPEFDRKRAEEVFKERALELGADVLKEGYKAVSLSPTTEVVVTKFLEVKTRRAFDDSWKQLMKDNVVEQRIAQLDPKFAEEWPKLVGDDLAKSRKEMERAAENYAEALGHGGFRKYAQKMGKDFASSLIREVAKKEIQKQIADFIEGDAWLECTEADLEVHAAFMVMMRDAAHYYAVKDKYEFLVDVRNKIYEHYDPKHEVQVLVNKSFYDTAAVLVLLEDLSRQEGKSEDREIEINLGGQIAERGSGSKLRFAVNALDLEHDSSGGVKLTIKVNR
jgi:hypothetical protein